MRAERCECEIANRVFPRYPRYARISSKAAAALPWKHAGIHPNEKRQRRGRSCSCLGLSGPLPRPLPEGGASAAGSVVAGSQPQFSAAGFARWRRRRQHGSTRCVLPLPLRGLRAEGRLAVDTLVGFATLSSGEIMGWVELYPPRGGASLPWRSSMKKPHPVGDAAFVTCFASSRLRA